MVPVSIFSSQIPNYKHMGKWKNFAVFFLLYQYCVAKDDSGLLILLPLHPKC